MRIPHKGQESEPQRFPLIHIDEESDKELTIADKDTLVEGCGFFLLTASILWNQLWAFQGHLLSTL